MPLFRKCLCGLLAFVNAAYPIAASARSYFFIHPVTQLQVVGSVPLGFDASNTSSTSASAGAAILRIAPSNIAFGEVPTGQASADTQVTFYNLGTEALTLGAVSASTQFATGGACDGVSLPPLGSCQTTVSFTPSQLGTGVAVTGLLTVPFATVGDSAVAYVKMSGTPAMPPPGALYDVELVGFSGSDPALTVQEGQAAIHFPQAYLNVSPVTQSFLLKSTGDSPLSINGLSIDGNDGSFSALSDCPAKLPVGETCTVTVTLSPITEGNKSATLQVSTNAYRFNSLPVSLVGNVSSQLQRLSYSTVLDWGAVDSGVATSKVLSVKNTGNQPVTGIVSTPQAPFTVSLNGCAGVTLQPDASCDITYSLSYMPNGPLSRTATLTADSLTVPATSIALQATVQTRTIAALSPSSLAFGLQSTQMWSATENFVTVTNTGNVTLKPAVGGRGSDNTLTAAPWVRVSSDTCAAGVAPGLSCKIGFQVKPATTTATTAVISVYPDGGMSTGAQNVSLTATGTPQSYSVSATALNFGTVGSNSYAEQTLTVTNTSPAGTAVTGFSGVAITNPTVPAGSGTLSVPTSTCGATLASQASCTLTLRYTAPSYTGVPVAPTGGSVAFYWTGARSTTTVIPATVTLTGTSLSASISSADFGDIPAGVTSASAARRVVTVTNNGSFPATLSTAIFDSTNALALIEDTSVSGRCLNGMVLQAGASCTTTLYSGMAATAAGGARSSTFTPRVAGLNGAVAAIGTPLTLIGNVLPATIATSVASLDFGRVGERASVSKTFTFRTSHGGAAMTQVNPVTGAGYSMAISGCTYYVPNNFGYTYTLTASETCTATVTFAPGTFTTETLSGSVALNFNINGKVTTLATVSLTGQVESAAYAVDYNDLNWGDVPTQTAGALRYAVIRNTSTLAIVPFTGARSVAAPFAISGATATYSYNGAELPNCTSLAQLAPGASCYVGVSLSGATGTSGGAGAFNGNATLATSTALGSLTLPMTANFLPASPAVSASAITFPTPTASTTSHVPDMTVTVTNGGEGRFYWGTPAGYASPLNATGNFWIVKANGTAAQGITPSTVANSTRCEEMTALDAGGSCVLTVRFTPTGAAGTKTGALKLGTLTPTAQTLSVDLSGTALAGTVTVSQTAMDFGAQWVGSNTVQTLIIGNSGNGPLNLQGIARVRNDGAAAQYPLDITAAHDCPATLDPGQACHINVTFVPDRNLNWGTLASKEAVQFQHYSNGAWTTVRVPISGVSSGSVLTASRHAHALGMVDKAVVAKDYVDTVTFTASGAAPVRITGFSPTTLTYLESYSGGTCATDLTLQPGESCTVLVRNRADFSNYPLGAASALQTLMTINGTYYKDASTVQSDRSVQLQATATVVTPATLVEMTPRAVSTYSATPVSLFGTGFRVGAEVRLDGTTVLDSQFVSVNEMRSTVPAGLSLGAHLISVRNTDGRSNVVSVNFTVSSDQPARDSSLPVYTAMYDRPQAHSGTISPAAVVLADGRKIYASSSGAIGLYDANDVQIASTTVASDGNPIRSIRLSVVGDTLQVGWLSAYVIDGTNLCLGNLTCWYYYVFATDIYANVQSFTIGATSLTGSPRASTQLYHYYATQWSHGVAMDPTLRRAPTFEGLDISRNGTDTAMAYSYSILNVGRFAEARIWSGSTTAGPAYSLNTLTGQATAVGTAFQGNTLYVRQGDSILSYSVAGTTLSGGASYQYVNALGADGAPGLSFSTGTNEVLTSCYGGTMVCAIPSVGEALGLANALAGTRDVPGYVDGAYGSALFNTASVGAAPAGMVLLQASVPQAVRILRP